MGRGKKQIGITPQASQAVTILITSFPKKKKKPAAMLQRQASTVTSPSVQRQQFSPPLVLLVQVLRDAAAHLGERAPHYFAEITL